MKVPPIAADLLRAGAPILLGALTGPLGGIAATVASAALKHWLPPPPEGVSPEQRVVKPAEIAFAIEQNAHDPKLLLDLQKAEIDLKRFEAEAESNFKWANLAKEDRDSARAFARDTGTASSAYRLGWVILAVDAVVTVAALVGGFLVIQGTVEIRDQNVLIAVFTLAGGIVGRISARADVFVNYIFGSSSGSKDKTDTLNHALGDLGAALADRPPPVAPAPPPPPVVAAPPAAPSFLPVSTAPDLGRPSRFLAVIDHLLSHEGGYVDHPHDPGGCTNFGITLGALKDWRGGEASCDDVRALSKDEAKAIYFAKYWNALSCDSLPAGLDYIVFDFGVNAGVKRSAKFLQKVLAKRDPSLKSDGVIGPMTLSAAAKAPVAELIEAFHAERMRHYKSLSTWSTFGKGWANRSEAVLASALAAGGSNTTALA